jgi:hypothetical protein
MFPLSEESSIRNIEDITFKCDTFYPVQEDFNPGMKAEAVGATRQQIYLLTIINPKYTQIYTQNLYLIIIKISLFYQINNKK